ncbi:restriction endonuclease subunit S [Pseudoalteromonas sp. AOP31-A2-14]|uniref:restriction endonuclease subunit S n=1 Tax=unclassified Pseudoalteromonas TaxID=194690 RepID=UPI003F956405
MEFKSYTFKDLLENIVDNRGKTCPVQSSGIPLIATNCIKDNSLYAEYERVRYISDETYKTWFRGHPKPEDIIFVCKGSPGRVAWVQNPVPYCIAQDMVAIRANKNVIDSKFLFALLRSPKAQKSILNMHVGTMIPHFKKGDFSKLYFDIPSDLEYQKWAGEVYFSFSEKIELNKQTNQTLEQMAQALFKSWFVDFDPVFDNLLASVDFKLENLETSLPDELKLKAQRRLAALNSLHNADECKASLSALAHELQAQLPTKAVDKGSETLVKADFNVNPNILAQHANTHSHFPNEFEHNEQLGWIPKGWSASSVEDEFVVKGGSTPSTKNPDFWEGGEIHWTSPKDLSGNTTKIMLDTSRKITSAGLKKITSGLLPIDTVLMSSRAPVGYLALAKVPVAINQGYIAITDAQTLSSEYTIQWLDSVMDEIKGISGGTTFAEISKKTFKSIQLVIPSKKAVEAYTEVTKMYYERITACVQEINTLTETRDYLLPKLISGELQIPDVATDEEVVN